MERNSMVVRDVRGDTHYAVEGIQKVSVGRKRKTVTVAQVIALKRCGCNGPGLGQVQTVPFDEWPHDMPPAQDTKAKLWAAYANGGYKPVAHAWGMDGAAKALRNWHAVRNVNHVMKNREPTRGLSQASQ